MTRAEYLAQIGAVTLLATGLLLDELLVFRLLSATLGKGPAIVYGLVAPALGGLGAVLLARARHDAPPARIATGAAHFATVAALFVAVSLVALNWVGQRIALADGDGSQLDVVIAVVGWLLAALFGGAAMAMAMRLGLARIGRMGFAEALGCALAALFLPALLNLGAPRVALATSLVFGLAACALAYVGRHGRPRWPALTTVVLVGATLLAGDLGKPWLEFRIYLGRRSQVEYQAWTAGGVVAFNRVRSGKSLVRVDQSAGMLLPLRLRPGGQPRFDAQDLIYLFGGEARGPALVIGSGGGREVQAALSFSHHRVDVVEADGTLLRLLLHDRYAKLSDWILRDKERVRLRIGDGRAALARSARHYQRIVVLGEPDFGQSSPRFLPHHDRLFTVEAIVAYLDHLTTNGTLLMRVPTAELPALGRSLIAASGGDVPGTRQRTFACSDLKGRSVMLVHATALDGIGLGRLARACAKNRSTVALSPATAPPKPAKRSRPLGAPVRSWAEVQAARAATDARPFLSPAPAMAALAGVAVSALQKLPPAKAKPWEPGDERRPAMTTVGLAAAGSALAGLVLVLIVGLLLRGASVSGERAPARALRVSFPLFGIALALCMFSLSDALLRLLGAAAYAWPVIVAVGWVGVGAGRLVVDSIAIHKLRRVVLSMLVVGSVGLALLHWAVRGLADRLVATPSVAAVFACAVLLAGGAWLGLPLAAALKLALRDAPALVPACYGAHLTGWAVGGGLALLLSFYQGVTRLFPLGLVVYVAGAAVLAFGLRQRPRGPLPPTGDAAATTTGRA